MSILFSLLWISYYVLDFEGLVYLQVEAYVCLYEKVLWINFFLLYLFCISYYPDYISYDDCLCYWWHHMNQARCIYVAYSVFLTCCRLHYFFFIFLESRVIQERRSYAVYMSLPIIFILVIYLWSMSMMLLDQIYQSGKELVSDYL